MPLTNAHVNAANGHAYPNSQGAAWGHPASWAAFNFWDTNPHTSIEYLSEVDARKSSPMLPLTLVSASDGTDYVVTESHSLYGADWTSYAPIGGPYLARYNRVKITASGPYPILRDVNISITTVRRHESINDLNTSTITGAQRIGVGDIRLDPGDLTIITNVAVTFNGLDAHYRFELVDKDPVLGPRIKIYDTTTWVHQPADALIDVIISGA